MSAIKNRGRILIVDDEETVGIGMSEILKDAVFTADYVTSGKAAIEEMKRGGCSLIFMDMLMPDMNGLETYRRLKDIHRGVRVVLITGYFKEVEKIVFEGVKEGMLDLYIRKPFYVDELIHVARKYV